MGAIETGVSAGLVIDISPVHLRSWLAKHICQFAHTADQLTEIEALCLHAINIS